MSSNKVKGAGKNETLQEKIEKAREKKEAAKERKQGKKTELEAPKSTIPKVQRNAKDKKMANFLHQASTNREKQQATKKEQVARMQAKLVQIREAKEQDSDDDEGDEGDEGDEDMPEGEEEEGDEEEQLALQEFEGELANSDEKPKKRKVESLPIEEEEDEEEDDEEQGGLTEVASMEDLKKKFSGKHVPSVEELKSEAEREARLDAIVKKREEQRKEFLAERQAKQAVRRRSKQRKLQGNQRTRVGPNYMPFLSKGF